MLWVVHNDLAVCLGVGKSEAGKKSSFERN